MHETGRVMTWKIFEVVSVSHKPGFVKKFENVQEIVKKGMNVGVNSFPWAPKVLREAPILNGMALPALMSIRFYAHFMAYLLNRYRGVCDGALTNDGTTMRQRFYHLLLLELS